MKHLLITLILLSAMGLGVEAQPWVKMTKSSRETVNYYDLKASYDTHFETQAKVRGTGYKQFERYAWFMEPRVYPSGILPEKALWQAWQEKQSLKNLKTDGITAEWVPIGPFDTPLDLGGGGRAGSGRINCVAFHPTDEKIMYVGAPSGGVWKTIDGGANWTNSTDQLPALGVSDLAIDPQNPSTVYMVTGDKDGGNTCPTYSYGILKSTDAGESWNATGLVHETSSTIRMRRLVINPDNPQILVTGGSSGLFRSEDGGDSWTEISSANYFDLEYHPANSNILYAATNNTISKSVDAGLSFTALTNGFPDMGIGRIEMAVTLANPEVLYAILSNSASEFGALIKSVDAGETFTTQSTEDQINIFNWDPNGEGDGGIAWYSIALAVDQEDENLIYAGCVNHWKSADAGQNWTISAHWYGANGLPYVHADNHTLAVNPLNNNCYSGNDGGFYETTDKGVGWTDLSDGLSILQIYRMGSSQTNPDLILEGSQDNGTYLYNAGRWNGVRGGDGMECAIDPTDEYTRYSTTQSGGLARQMNGGGWTNIRPSDKGSWITPFEISQLNHNVIVAGYEVVYLSSNFGTDWEAISGELAGGSNLNEVSLAPSDDKYIYVSNGSNLWMTSDRGVNWEKISDPLPNISIEYITVAQSDPQKVWVSLSGYAAGEKVFFSDDAGRSWTNYSDGLPNVPVNCITYKNNSNYSLYAGTDLGIYYRNADLEEWVPFDDGLPNVIVNEMEVNYKINKIRAATFGRGMWESSVVDDGNWPPAIQLTSYNSDGSISLSWIEATGREPESYAIYRNGEFYQSTSTNEFVDQVENWITYEYIVKAIYSDGESTPTNAVMGRGEAALELPYEQVFDTEAHGWMIKNKVSGWQWGTGAELGLSLLGDSKMVGINSEEASKENKNADDYAILPKLNLAGKDNLELKFDYALRRWQELDHLYLVYRTEDKRDWSILFEIEPSNRMWRWKTIQIDMPQEVLADGIEFAFHYTDNKDIGYGAAIDNFYIGPKASGTDNLAESLSVDVYPNPVDEELTINLHGLMNQDVVIEITDLTGRVVLQKNLSINQANQTETINLVHITKGLYQVMIISDKITLIKRISII